MGAPLLFYIRVTLFFNLFGQNHLRILSFSNS